MKVAFIGGRNIHILGGIETYMRNLCTELVKLGIEPIVYCESDRTYSEIYNGFIVYHWKSPKSVYLCKIFLGFKSTLHALIHEKNVDIFHYNAWPPSLASWIPRIFRKKTIFMGHGLEWKRTKYSPKKQKVMKLMERYTAFCNTNFVMCSQEQTEYYKTTYNKNCVTIPTAVYLPSSNSINSSILQKFNICNPYFLYLGRLVQDKNPDILIKAFVKLNLRNVQLVIAGSNDSDPQYVSYLHELANSHVIFTGAVYGDDKEQLLASCDVFCIPSTIEGLAITLLEAMSYSKPVIASDIPANKEGLGNNGIWVTVQDVESLSEKLQYCIDNSSSLAEIGLANYKRVVSNFTWNKISLMYKDYIYSI